MDHSKDGKPDEPPATPDSPMTLEQIESEMHVDTSSTGYILSGAGVKPFSAKRGASN